MFDLMPFVFSYIFLIGWLTGGYLVLYALDCDKGNFDNVIQTIVAAFFWPFIIMVMIVQKVQKTIERL